MEKILKGGDRMEFFEVIQKRRSVRSLEKIKSPGEDILKILEAGRLAPSGRNAQVWEFIVIDDENLIKELGKIQSFISDSSVVIGVIMNPEESKFWIEDASAAIENMLLTITYLGYASCWVEGTLLKKEEWAKRLLGIPEEKRLIALLPIGKAKSEVEKPYKKPLSSIVHHNRYGQSYL